MSFKDWLFTQLCNDGLFDENENSVDDVTVSNLYSARDFDASELCIYKDKFTEYCKSIGKEPIWDVV